MSATLRRGRPLTCEQTPFRKAENARAVKRYYSQPVAVAWARSSLSNAMRRAKHKQVDVALTVDQVVSLLPPDMKCPILGIPLAFQRGKGIPSPNSPTIDRIDPGKGYTIDNVHVISDLANRAKCQMTLEQAVAMGRWAAQKVGVTINRFDFIHYLTETT